MPKKTKKEKILAEYRKRLRIIQQQTQQKDSQPVIEKKEVLINKKNVPIITKDEKNLINYNFLQDLKKSFLISFFLIALEFFLYFAKLIK